MYIYIHIYIYIYTYSNHDNGDYNMIIKDHDVDQRNNFRDRRGRVDNLFLYIFIYSATHDIHSQINIQKTI